MCVWLSQRKLRFGNLTKFKPICFTCQNLTNSSTDTVLHKSFPSLFMEWLPQLWEKGWTKVCQVRAYRVSRFWWTDIILCGCLSPKKHELRAWKSLGNWFDDSFLTASTMRLILSSGFCIRNRTTIYRAITKSGHKNRKYRGFTRITMGQYRAQ